MKNRAAQLLGRLGGKQRVAKHGAKSLRDMQSKGGKAILRERGPEYYRELNKKSQEAKKALKRQAKKLPTPTA